MLVLEAVEMVEAARRRRCSQSRDGQLGGGEQARQSGGGLLVLELADELCGLIASRCSIPLHNLSRNVYVPILFIPSISSFLFPVHSYSFLQLAPSYSLFTLSSHPRP